MFPKLKSKTWSSGLVKARINALVCSALLLPAAPAPAQLPTLGDGSDMSLAAERKLGDRIAKEIYRDPDYVDDPVLSEYMQGIWEPLLASARLRGELTPEMAERYAWVTLLIRDRSINAFALPGGYMGVHLGLIGLVANRDELASVLAHEISHVTQRHISRLNSQQARNMPWLIGAMILGALAASKSPNAAGALITGGQAAAVQSQLNFSRDMEREADRIGYNVMTQAGYQPQGFVSMFEKLQQSSRLNDNGAYPYLRSHPLTTERIADMQSRVGTGANTIALPANLLGQSLDHAMLAARARVLADPGVDALQAWADEAGSPQFGALPPHRQAAALYAAALVAAKSRDFGKAQLHLQKLTWQVKADVNAARLVNLLGVELALQEGEPRRALVMLGVDPARENLPRPELMLLSQAVQRLSATATATTTAPVRAAGQALLASTLQRMQAWVTLYPSDGVAWHQLAQLASASGQPLRALRAEAEVQAVQYDYPAALDRLKAAQEFARQKGLGQQAGEYIDASIIDTRLRQLEAQIKEASREQALQR